MSEVWYHGSNREFSLLEPGSTVTRQRDLAEAFSHKPDTLCLNDEGEIFHNGREEGILYVIDEPLQEEDLSPHPRTTMPPGMEYLTARPLRVKRIAATGPGIAQSGFFSMLLRMRYINRWGLMRSSRPESLSEHTLDTALLAHALAVLGVRRLGRTYDPQRAVMLALFHDAAEILTGDLPTPVKYHDPRITGAYRQVEAAANERLLALLPVDLREEYRPLLTGSSDPAGPVGEDQALYPLIKAADKLSALIKCVEEEQSGNREFLRAKESTLEALKQLRLPEVSLFMAEFFDSFTQTLDDQPSLGELPSE